MKKINFLILTLTLLSAGCTSYAINAEEIAIKSLNKPQHERSVEYIENVSVPYEVIGQVTVNTERRNSREDVIDKMKHQADILGADAITNIIQTDKPSAITRIRTIYTGTAIVFKDVAVTKTPQDEPLKTNTRVEENLK